MAARKAEFRQGLGAFVPADVRAAMARAEPRREHCEGSVLLADVSGFTPLTEAYAREYGPRRGAEEVAALLNRVYGALVEEVDRAGGTVVEFAGDAICCCVHDDDGSAALRCGLRMQAAMARLRHAGVDAEIRVAVGAGAFRRIAVGDPSQRIFEVVAGPAVDEVMAIAEDARRGDVVAHARVAERLEDRLTLADDRLGAGVIVEAVAGRDPAPAPQPPQLDDERARPWIAAELHPRLAAGGDVGLGGELRSVVALFARFEIDPGASDPDACLDAYVRFAQATIGNVGGSIFSIAVDDKGTYLCAGFGAPVAHDNDPQRAAAAALALRTTPPAIRVATVGIGLTRGRTYAGVYGGATRRMFGLQGAKTNLAARLMQLAQGGQILVEEPLCALLADDHVLERMPAVQVKGRSEPVALRALTAARRRMAKPGAAPRLVGRAGERALLDERLRALRAGQGGVVLLEGEPGIGKTRLVRHLADRAARDAITVHAGAGDPIERGAPYHGWRQIFDDELTLALGNGSASAGLSGDARAEATRDLLAQRLDEMAAAGPMLVVLEDAHWLDSASLALATRIAGAPGSLLLVVTTRPVAEAAVAELERLAATDACQRIALGPLQASEVREVAADAIGIELPADIAALVEAKAGGNPLFSRELARALRDRGVLDDTTPRGLELESPGGVEAVIASRIDRLPASGAAVLRIASVLGGSFRSDALRDLAGADVGDQVAVLEELELLGHDPSHGEDGLAFRHAVIRDVVYEQLLFADRRDLHRRAAEHLEHAREAHLPDATHAALAHHWERADVPDRAAVHYASAGEGAFRAGAFRECVDMLDRALALTVHAAEPLQRERWQSHIAESCYRLGDLERCHRSAAEAIAALDRPVPDGVPRILAAVLRELLRQVAYRLAPRGVLPRRVPPRDRERVRLAAATQFLMAEVYYLSSDTPRSSYVAIRSLNLAERLGPSRELAECYGALGVIAGIVGAHATAERYCALARGTADAVNDPFAIAITLHQQCMYRSSRGPYHMFADDYRTCIEGFRRLGHKPRLRDALGVAGVGDHLFGHPAEAERKLLDLLAGIEAKESSLPVTWAHAWIGIATLRRGDPGEALRRLSVAAGLSQDQALDMSSVSIHAVQALALRRSGRVGESRAEHAKARELAARLGPRPTSHAVLDGYAALAELALTDWDEARSWRARVRARRHVRSARRNLRVYERTFAIGGPARSLYEGERLWRLGRRARALAAWERARARAAELGMRHELALAHAVLGDRLAGDPVRREHHRAVAARLLDELGSPADTRPVTPLYATKPEAHNGEL